MIYGYARVSTKTQKIERQIHNLNKFGVDILFQEKYTGTTKYRKEFQKMLKQVKKGDSIIFDSVSRMSRNSSEGIANYFELMNKGINLIFIKERYIDTDNIQEQINNSLKTTLGDTEILQATEEYIKKILIIQAKEQVKTAFEQAQKEVDDIKKRTSEGLARAKAKGKRIGNVKGSKMITKKSLETKEKIKKISKKFRGVMNDKECIETLGIARNTFYKYIREIKIDES